MKPVLHPDWTAWVGAAADPPDIVNLCVQYLSLWSVEQLGALPERLRPPSAIRTAENIADYAFTLGRARLKEPHPSAELNAMATFVAAAATRLSQLLTAKAHGVRVPFFTKD